MAWKKRYSRPRRSYRSRAAGYTKSKMPLAITIPFIGGVVAGLTNIDDAIPKEVTLAVACAPIRGIGTFKAVAQGTVVGNLLQSRFGLNLGSALGSSTGNTGAGW